MTEQIDQQGRWILTNEPCRFCGTDSKLMHPAGVVSGRWTARAAGSDRTACGSILDRRQSPRRPRELVIPYQVDETRRPIDFKAIDSDHIDRCAKENRCGICGGKIRTGPVALIGPDDGRSCFADPWMHLDCAQLAMQQCPFLAGRKTWRDANGKDMRFISTYAHNMVLYTATNWRSHRDRFGHWHFEAIAGLEKLGQP